MKLKLKNSTKQHKIKGGYKHIIIISRSNDDYKLYMKSYE